MAVTTSSVGSPRQFFGDFPTGSIPNPTTAPTISWVGGAGTFTGGVTYYFAYSWLTNGGETLITTPVSSVAIAGGGSATVTIPAIPAGARGAQLYAGTNSSALSKTTVVIASGTSTTLSGPGTTGLTQPTANTTGVLCPVYTAPAYSANVTTPSSTSYIKELIVTNTTGTAANLTLTIGGTGANCAYMFYNTPIGANDSKVLSGLNTMLNANEAVYALSSTAGALTLTLSGVEVQ